MLVHNVDGEHLASYSDLLLAAQMLERQAEARDPLPPKMAPPSGSKITSSQMPGNLFPSCKLKCNCTFAAGAMIIRMDEAKEDPSKKPEGEGETELSADKDVEVSHGIRETDQPIEYIVCFAKVVHLNHWSPSQALE